MAILRPSSDISTGGWTSTAATAAEVLDEVSASDADYIETATIGNKCRVSLGTYTDPGNDNNHEIHYRASSADANHGLLVKLLELGQPPAIICKRSVNTRQPQIIAPLRTDIDIGFVLLPSIGSGYELVNRIPLPAGSPIAPQSVGSGGVSYDMGTTGSRTTPSVGIGNFDVQTSDFAVGVVGTFESITSTGVALSNYVPGAINYHWRLQPNYNGTGTSAGSLCFYTYGAGQPTAAGANSLIISGKVQSFLGVRRGTAHELWLDGVLVAATTGTVRQVSDVTTQNIGFGWGAQTYHAGGHRVFGYGIKGAVSPGLASELSRNPWSLFKGNKKPSFIDSPKLISSHTKTAAQLGTSPADQTLALSTGEASTITNGAELALEFEATTP